MPNISGSEGMPGALMIVGAPPMIKDPIKNKYANNVFIASMELSILVRL